MLSKSIGIISDTHGNHSLSEKICYYLINEKQVDCIYHLGDDYEDGEYLSSIGLPIKVVPGLWCDQFRDWKTPKIIKENILTVKIAFAHTLELLQKSNTHDCQILCCGHTHVPEIKTYNDQIIFNPGHLKKNVDRGQEATFGIIEFTDKTIIFEIISAIDVKRIVKKAQEFYNPCAKE